MRLTIPPELIEAAQAGKSEGMERLLETLWPHAYRIARSIIHDDALAEDAAQEACSIIYRELSGLRSAQAFRVWAYRIVAREAIRAVKTSAPAQTVTQDDHQPDLDARLDVLRALGELPADLRAAVVLAYYGDLNSSEIGTVLGVPSATVRFRLMQARRRLQALLSERTFNDVSKAHEVLL